MKYIRIPVVALVILQTNIGSLCAQSDSVKSESAVSQDNGKISGQVFFDYFYTLQARDTAKKDFNAFQFRRIFFTYDYTIAKDFETRLRLEADQIALTKNDKISFALKEANLKWKNFFDQSDLVVGLSPTPTWDISEREWNYRSLEKTIMDLQGIASRTDLGIDLKGKIGKETNAEYWIKAGNNSGNSPEKDKLKRIYGLIHFMPTPKTHFTAYGDLAAADQVVDQFDLQSKNNNAYVFAGFFDYREGNRYVVGIEAFYKTIQHGLPQATDTTGPLLNKHTSGISIFGWTSLTDEVRLVGRYDIYDPNTSVDNDGNSLFIGAIDFLPVPDVHIMPNVYVQSYQGKNISNDVFVRLTFHYGFH